MSKKLGALIKKARTDKGLTQSQLGDAAGLTATQVSKIESGASEPDKDVLKKMAKPLGMTQKALLEAAGFAEAKASSAKTSSAKKTSSSGKSTSSKKTSSSTGKTASSAKKTSSSAKKSDTDTLTATEKKLIKLYRKADADTKKDVMNTLEGKSALGNLFGSLFGGKGEGLSALLGGKTDGLAALLGGKSEKAAVDGTAPELSQSQMQSLLEGLAAMAKRDQEQGDGLTLLRSGPEEEKD